MSQTLREDLMGHHTCRLGEDGHIWDDAGCLPCLAYWALRAEEEMLPTPEQLKAQIEALQKRLLLQHINKQDEEGNGEVFADFGAAFRGAGAT